jgi:hypothetical protein
VIAKLYAWLLGLPTSLATLVVVGFAVAVSVLGFLAFHLLVPHPLRSRHNDVAGFTLGPVGVVYAVLLAFIAVAVWEDFGRAGNLVATEANLVGNLYRDTVGLPDPPAADLRHDLFVYAETVVQDEWPALAAGQVADAAGWQLLDRFHLALVQLRPPDRGTGVVAAEMLRELGDLYSARRGRFQAAGQRLPPILWWNLLAGAAIVMVVSYLFGVPSLGMHAAMIALLGASIGLVLALILLLQSPFRGENHVSAQPFAELVATVERMDFPRK